MTSYYAILCSCILCNSDVSVCIFVICPHMERIGATISSDAMRMPSSAMSPVSSRAHVGSPLALPCPKTCARANT